MSFWDEYQEWPPTRPTAERVEVEQVRSSQSDTFGVCEFCGFAGDDVLLGVCVDCTDDEGSQP